MLKLKIQAVKWYRKAAEQGHATAQSNLGFCYLLGHGVESNLRTGYMWLYLAKLNGNTNADEWLKEINISFSEKSSAESEARRKFDEIKNRNGTN